MTRIFRTLVILNLGLYLLWFHFPYVDPFLFDETSVELWALSGIDAKFDFPTWYGYLWVLYWILVAVGLFQFYRWSRDALIIGYVLGFLLAPIYGTVLESPASTALGDLNTLLDGIVLGMAYFSPLADKFGKVRSSNSGTGSPKTAA